MGCKTCIFLNVISHYYLLTLHLGMRDNYSSNEASLCSLSFLLQGANFCSLSTIWEKVEKTLNTLQSVVVRLKSSLRRSVIYLSSDILNPSTLKWMKWSSLNLISMGSEIPKDIYVAVSLIKNILEEVSHTRPHKHKFINFKASMNWPIQAEKRNSRPLAVEQINSDPMKGERLFIMLFVSSCRNNIH